MLDSGFTVYHVNLPWGPVTVTEAKAGESTIKFRWVSDAGLCEAYGEESTAKMAWESSQSGDDLAGICDRSPELVLQRLHPRQGDLR